MQSIAETSFGEIFQDDREVLRMKNNYDVVRTVGGAHRVDPVGVGLTGWAL